MLVDKFSGMIEKRSTGRISAKGMAPFMRMMDSSKTLYDFDNTRSDRELKFTAVNMMTVCMFMDIKHLTFEGLRELFEGRGGQVILKNLGMPIGADGRYLRPSDGWISDFRNHLYPCFRHRLEQEMAEGIIGSRRNRGGTVVMTCDSTPLEASRYSAWAAFNPHYMIRMAKAHIIMIDGIPLFYRITNGNVGDNPVYRDLLQRFDGIRMRNAVMLVDGGYDSCESYIDTYLKTGCVMSGNAACNSVIHEAAMWKNVLRRYNRLHGLPDFVPARLTNPDFIIRFLAHHGEREIAGWFLRNLDLKRGSREHARLGRIRHVCETVHHAMKRWVDLDVRGLNRRYAGRRVLLRLFFCQMLVLTFKPYEIC